MSRLILAVAFALFAVPAKASDWWFVNLTNDHRLMFVDASLLNRRHDIANVWWTIVHARPDRSNADPVIQEVNYSLIGCRPQSRSMSHISQDLYAESGKLVFRNEFNPVHEQFIASKSSHERIKAFACSDRSTWEAQSFLKVNGSPTEFVPLYERFLKEREERLNGNLTNPANGN